jgi:serine/threonine protein kinase
MDLVTGVSLLNYLKIQQNRKLNESNCKIVFGQIVRGIAYCHFKNICHRDIKLENIIIDESKKVKLIDFGFGTITANDKLLNFFCGTPSYMPPEIVQKKDYIGKRIFIYKFKGKNADVWSLGILLYTLLCGAFPFRALNEKELYNKIVKGIYNFPDHITSKAANLIQKILNLNPNERPTAEGV